MNKENFDPVKWRNAISVYTNQSGPLTTAEILDQIPFEVAQKLPGRQLGMLMNAINAVYQAGRNDEAKCTEEIKSVRRSGVFTRTA